MSQEHRAALEYDWRARFGLSFSEVGGPAMGWGEAVRLVGLLGKDPSSQTCAVVSQWDAPRSVEWLVLADLFDATVRAHFQRPQTYPRPFRDGVRKGKTDLPRAQVISLLNRVGHQFPEEDDDG